MSKCVLFFFLLFSSVYCVADDIQLYVVIPSYNNEKYCEGNLQSIANQSYPHWTAIYIDDHSTDATYKLVPEFIAAHQLENKILFIRNAERRGALANTYYAVKGANPKSVIIIVDGDDELAHNDVFATIAATYQQNPDIWLTYGNYVAKPNNRPSCCQEYPKKIIQNHAFRKHPFIAGHLRTFYAGLFQKIRKEDLCCKGQFLQSSGDVATMLPMLEMASEGHFLFIDETLYIYNDNNPLNDFNNRGLQHRMSQYVRKLAPYKPLKYADWK